MDAACAARPEEPCIDVETALAFADGQLDEAARAAIEVRIDACPRCRGIIAEAARNAEQPILLTVSQRRSKRRENKSPSLDTGEHVGRYVVERAIGAGGMGVVSLARDPELKRPVVIKLVRADIWGDESRDELEARLRREAQAMAQLSHPNVVQIFDIGHHGDRVFLAMEYVPGETLDVWLERRHTPAEIIAMLRQAGAGLDAAHRAGLVHRDFKPANVLVNTEGVAKVTDFGLARIPAGGPMITRKLTVPKPSGIHAALTAANAIVGTPAYMAPEQEKGQADARSDQFAFALVLLDALVGQSPVARRVHANAELDDRMPEVPPRVRAAVQRALSPDPEARFPTMEELLDELVPPSTRRARSKWPILAGVGLCGVAVAVWFATRSDAPVAGPECTADATRVWTPDARQKLVAAYAADPRPFGGWTGASVAAAIDHAVERLAHEQVAQCHAARSPAADCLARRQQALAQLIESPLDDAWTRMRGIDDCKLEPPSPELAKLREELAGKPARGRAEQLAEVARKLHDDRLAGEAYELAGLAALDTDDLDGATRLLSAEAEAGERANDDATRGRAHLYLLAVAAHDGDLAAVTREANFVDSMLARQQRDPRAELAAALHEAAAFEEVGDVTRAHDGWQAALDAARTLGSVDDHLRARAGLAWARYTDHFDLATARTEITEALADAAAATGPAKATALAVQGDLAVAAGDAEAARTAYAESRRLDPARTDALADRLRAIHARALTDVEGALAELASIRDKGPAHLRVELARGEILRAAGRARDAQQLLLELSLGARDPYLTRRERLEVLLERCAADADLGRTVACDAGELVRPLHPQAPIRARIYQTHVRALQTAGRTATRDLEALLALYEAAAAPPVRLAELRWDLARDPQTEHGKAVELATSAREGFVTAHRDADVDAIDRWLAAPASDAGVGPDVDATPATDRRGPQP